MESTNDNHLLEEDANASGFRRRNNIIVLILICFIISLILIIASITFYMNLLNFPDPNYPTPLNPALQAYCSFVCNTPSRINIFNSIVDIKSVTNPNQIFTFSLQTAAKELENLLSIYGTEPVFRNCSGSFRVGSVQIRDVLATMRVNPFVEMLSEEQRNDMVKRIMTADGNLTSCLDDLAKVESTAVSEAREMVHRVKVYLSGGGNFLYSYDVVLQNFLSVNVDAIDWRSVIFEYVVIVFVCGLYLWFIFYFCRALCRFVGVKSFPLARRNSRFRAVNKEPSF